MCTYACTIHTCTYIYTVHHQYCTCCADLLKVASSDVRVLHLSEVDKAIVIAWVRLETHTHTHTHKHVHTHTEIITIVSCIHMYRRISKNHNSLGCEQASRPRCKTITQCAGRVSANSRPHQLCWGDRVCDWM